MHERELLELIPALRGRSLTLSPLGGGLTNRNFRIEAEEGNYVLRVAGPETNLLGIERACEVACARAAAALGIGPELVAYLPEHGAMVRRFVTGRVLTAQDMQQPPVLRRALEALRRYHHGPSRPGSFSPFATIRRYYAVARERGVAFPESLEPALQRLSRLEAERRREDDRLCPCHNDLLAANFIDDGASVWIIDWEYGGVGDRFFDLGNLAANNEFDDRLEAALLALYFGEARPDDLRRLQVMRQISDLREAMWGFLQSALSTLDVDYLAYGQKHLDRFLEAE